MKNILKHWAPALLMMAVIFGFSSIPSEEMPSFGGLDFSIKKFGHALGYALLSSAFLHGLHLHSQGAEIVNPHENTSRKKSIGKFIVNNPSFFAWLMTILYSITDEAHQSLVPGRNPSPLDVLIYDNIGAMLGILISNTIHKKGKR